MGITQALIENTINNNNLLKNDFIAISFINSDIAGICTAILFTVFLFFILYLIGDKLRLRLFNTVYIGNLVLFINISLGYIFISTGIALLGFFSFLYTWSLFFFFFLIICFALYPLSSLTKSTKDILCIFNEYKQRIQEDRILHIAILCFILVSFLRLIPPETGVDAIWYHTDYPRIYVQTHSMMNVDPLGKFYPIVNPTLGHMLYIVTTLFNIKDASRYLHFGFYVLVILLFIIAIEKKRYPYAYFAPLLIATSPTILGHASSAYSEFQWLLCWATVFFVLTGANLQTKRVLLSGLLFGGALATKIWMLQFYPVCILYIYFASKKRHIHIKKGIRFAFLFILISFLIPLMWYARAWIITGNPVFPSFSSYPIGAPSNPSLFLSLSFPAIKERIYSFVNVSPLSIIGFIFLWFSLSHIKTFVKKSNAYIFISLLSFLQLILPMYLGRYLIPFYSLVSIVLSIGIHNFSSIHKYCKYSVYLCIFAMFGYYCINALLQVSYGLGWADKNRYLTRILSRDNSSYYDYDHRFSKYLSSKDTVTSYGIWGFYYANFSYLYAEDVFNKKGRSLQALIESGATKLLIKGGDMQWLCITARLTDCNKHTYTYLTKYEFSHMPASQYLYALQRKNQQ